MCKPIAKLLVILALLLLAAGCTAKSAAPTVPTTVPAATDNPAEETLPQASTSAATEDPVAGESEAPAATAGTEQDVPYLQQIEVGQSVYHGPGYDFGRSSIVPETGIYTIVEEEVDYEGNLWGRLKSGIGWVDLTEIQSEEYQNALLRANYAGDALLLHGAYHYYPGDASEYCIPIVFRARGELRDVALFDLQLTAEGYLPGADLYTLTEMDDALPLVAELDFPGDMSMYGIRFVDDADITHTCILYISGRNGDLELEEQPEPFPTK